MKLNIFMVTALVTLPILGACTETPQKTVLSGLLTSAGFQMPVKSVKAPDFSLQNLDGTLEALTDYREKSYCSISGRHGVLRVVLKCRPWKRYMRI